MMTTIRTAIEYQVSDHGAGKFSVQLFDADSRELLDDSNIVKDVDGWRVVTLRGDGLVADLPQFDTPRAAAEHHATTFNLARK